LEFTGHHCPGIFSQLYPCGQDIMDTPLPY
jgi:hypothetical protein